MESRYYPKLPTRLGHSPLVVLSLYRPLVVLSCQLVVASPLAILSLCCPLVVLSPQLSHCLLPSSHCTTLSSTPRASLLSMASPHPLVVLLPALSSSCLAGWLLSCLSMRRPLVISLSCRATSRCLVAPAGCVASSSLVVLSLHRPLVLSSCWLVVVLPVLAPPSHPLVVVHRRCHRTPLNAAAAFEHHRHRCH